MPDIEDRVVSVYVRDAENALVKGATIAFRVNGVDAGGVEQSDGHATLQVASGDALVEVCATYRGTTQTAKLATGTDSYTFHVATAEDAMPDDPKIPAWFPAAAFGVGVLFVVLVLILTTVAPNPSKQTYTLYRIVMSMGCAGFATALTGFLAIKMKFGTGVVLMAGGSLAVFVIVYFWDPASNIVQSSSEVHSGSAQPRDASVPDTRRIDAAQAASGPATLDDLHVRPEDLISTYAGSFCMVSTSNTIAYCNHADKASCQKAYDATAAGAFKENHHCAERPNKFYCFAYKSIDRLGADRILDLSACFVGSSDCEMSRTRYRAIPGIQTVARTCDTLTPP